MRRCRNRMGELLTPVLADGHRDFTLAVRLVQRDALQRQLVRHYSDVSIGRDGFERHPSAAMLPAETVTELRPLLHGNLVRAHIVCLIARLEKSRALPRSIRRCVPTARPPGSCRSAAARRTAPTTPRRNSDWPVPCPAGR